MVWNLLSYQLYGGLSLIGKTAVLKTASNRDKRRGRSSRPPLVMLGCLSGLRSFTANEVVIEMAQEFESLPWRL